MVWNSDEFCNASLAANCMTDYGVTTAHRNNVVVIPGEGLHVYGSSDYFFWGDLELPDGIWVYGGMAPMFDVPTSKEALGRGSQPGADTP